MALRFAYSFIRSAAMSLTCFLVLFLSLVQASLPILFTLGMVPSLPVNFVILNSPVILLKLYGVVVDDTSFDPVESKILYD